MPALNGFLALGTMSAAGVFTEISGAVGYARQAIVLEAGAYGKMRNTNAIAFPKNSAAEWPAYDAYAVYDKATGGSIQFAWRVAQERGIYAGNRARALSPGSITIEFPVATSESGSEVVLSKPFLWTPGGLQRFEESPVTPTGSSVARSLGDVLGESRPRGARLAALGDSITAAADNITGNHRLRRYDGYLTWVNVLTRQRFDSPPSLNFGISGDTIEQMLARLPQVLAAQPDVCIVLGGTNGLNSATTTDEQIAQLKAIYDGLNGIGCTVIAVPITGRGGASETSSAGRLRAHAINSWIRSQVGTRRNFYVADCGVAFDDPTSALWAPRSGYTYDGLHPNSVGAYAIALKIKAILDLLYPDWRVAVSNQTDVYNPASNPRGNLVLNGSFDGGSTVATSWGLITSGALGATATASKATLADGRNAQRLVMSGTYTGSNGIAYFNGGITNLADMQPGDEIVGEVEFEAAAGFQNISHIYLYFQTTEGGTAYQRWGASVSLGDMAWPSGAVKGILRTPSRVLAATPSAFVFRAGIAFISPQASSAPISGQVDFAAASLRKVL